MQHVDEFIRAAVVPRNTSHAEGTLDEANALLNEHPDMARASMHAAAVLGDVASIRSFLREDPASAVHPGGPYGWDPLTHLCFSRYLKLDADRSAGFVECARLLLDWGASANAGFYEAEPGPEPTFESVLYGAAGVAHHPELTQLLLENGADPNDDEVPYHTPETYDNRALKILVESGKITPENLTMMVIRKIDWHDGDGLRWLLEHGAPSHIMQERGWSPLHHAISRGNAMEAIELLLEHGADPAESVGGRSAVSAAAHAGRGDILEAFAARNGVVQLDGVDRLIAACASGDEKRARAMAAAEPALLAELLARGGALLGAFALNGNANGVRCLLDLGVHVNARFAGDAYRGLPPFVTALHAAAWMARHDVVALMIQRGADVNARDSHNRSPLMYAVRATVDSYWTSRRAPDSVAALLGAGASTDGIPTPVGYDEVDRLLAGQPLRNLRR
jgi:ankyrin repeat protein